MVLSAATVPLEIVRFTFMCWLAPTPTQTADAGHDAPETKVQRSVLRESERDKRVR